MNHKNQIRTSVNWLTSIWGLILLAHSGSLLADAIVRSQAMFANTIAEYYVEDDHVRLELEIGQSDVGPFRNLLPDALYRQLDFGDTPLEERVKIFESEDMPLYVDALQLHGLLLLGLCC